MSSRPGPGTQAKYILGCRTRLAEWGWWWDIALQLTRMAQRRATADATSCGAPETRRDSGLLDRPLFRRKPVPVPARLGVTITMVDGSSVARTSGHSGTAPSGLTEPPRRTSRLSSDAMSCDWEVLAPQGTTESLLRSTGALASVERVSRVLCSARRSPCAWAPARFEGTSLGPSPSVL